jgi:hypothetical protein
MDLCRLVDHPTPAEADPLGESYCFERFAEKLKPGITWPTSPKKPPRRRK